MIRAVQTRRYLLHLRHPKAPSRDHFRLRSDDQTQSGHATQSGGGQLSEHATQNAVGYRNLDWKKSVRQNSKKQTR